MTDKEKIRAEIERRIEMYRNTEHRIDPNRINEDENLLAFIDSLPEEPAPKGYDEAYLNECIAKASKTWKGVDVDKFMDEVRGREADNLDEAAEEYASINCDDYVDYESNICFIEEGMRVAFKAGAEWQKEQMMKDAVEGEVVKDISNKLAVTAKINLVGFKFGQKVKIIILPVEKK